jgi:hypothetical protein
MMSEWEGKSDREIDIAVTCFKNNLDFWEFNGDEFYHCGIDGSGYFSHPIINYCNSPTDAWGIISKHRISIEYRDHKTLKPVAKRFGSNSHNIADKNVLRAAMIVYLEMNGVKPNEEN